LYPYSITGIFILISFQNYTLPMLFLLFDGLGNPMIVTYALALLSCMKVYFLHFQLIKIFMLSKPMLPN
jgi:hypothetical protein